MTPKSGRIRANVTAVGAGHAAGTLAAALRRLGYAGSVTLLGNEGLLPYQRPPLTKAFMLGRASLDEVVLRPDHFYSDRGIEVLAADPAVHIDRAGHELALASGRQLPYGQLVLATGSRPKVPPIPGRHLGGVLTLRSAADAVTLRERLSDSTLPLVVIGAGFVGMELAAVARTLGHDVVVLERGSHALTRAVSAPTADALTSIHRQQGVRMVFDAQVRAIHGTSDGQVAGVELADGMVFLCDLVVVAAGAQANTDLAEAAGLEVDDGIVVDAGLRTRDLDIFAIGDCAQFPLPGGHSSARLESVQNAGDQAQFLAGRLVADHDEPYRVQPWFWSDQYDTKLQIAGLVEGYDRTVLTGDPGDNTFSTFCFRGDRLLGIESVNRPSDHIWGRRHLATGGDQLTPDIVGAPSFSMREFAQARSAG